MKERVATAFRQGGATTSECLNQLLSDVRDEIAGATTHPDVLIKNRIKTRQEQLVKVEELRKEERETRLPAIIARLTASRLLSRTIEAWRESRRERSRLRDMRQEAVRKIEELSQQIMSLDRDRLTSLLSTLNGVDLTGESSEDAPLVEKELVRLTSEVERLTSENERLKTVPVFDVDAGTETRAPPPKRARDDAAPASGGLKALKAATDATAVDLGRVKREKEALEDRLLCIVCQEADAPRAVVFGPCNHFLACASCADALQECPNCRATITTRITIANSS